MYRQFKYGSKPSQKDPEQDNCQVKQIDLSDPEAERKVAKCWEAIQLVCSNKNCQHKQTQVKAGASGLGGWQTVRIFVSSTFTDFFSEREMLIKRVFPELREWCQDRMIKLVECDLRWGVPKDATSTQALLTCLEEIDRCYETNGQPFFLTMLGERYGWIPEYSEIPEDAREKYSWVDGTSMTFMEILHAVLRIKNPNASFFLRDPGFITQLPDSYVSRFQSESSLAKEHMKELKSQLISKYPQQVFPYMVDYGGLSSATGREQVNLTGLDKFAQQVKEFFQDSIEKAYPKQTNTTKLSPEETEQKLQWLFVQDKAETLIGRDEELQLLQHYARGDPELPLDIIVFSNVVADGKNSTIRKTEEWDVQKGDNLMCLVTAEGGWGKTALLASLVNSAVKEGKEVFYHFVGSTANSQYHYNLVQRLLLAISPDPADSEVNDPESDLATKKKLLCRFLTCFRENKKEMLIVIDGVNELDNSGSVYHLSWLPPSLPGGLRCVVSTNVSHLPTTARLYEHPAYCLTLSVLNSVALQDIATRYFANYGKKLESSQLQKLVETTKVDNPLWIMLMCEELRVFGDFRMMDKMLEDLPDTMDAFLAKVIGRLLEEDDFGYVRKLLFLTTSSRNGLPTDYILQLLGNIENKTECAPMYWAQARRILKPYSRMIQASGDVGEYFTFIHEAMWKAAKQCMETREEDLKFWHKQLADFYQYICDHSVLRITYLPFQLQQARLQKRLVEFIRFDPDAAKIPAFQRSRYLTELRCRSPSGTVLPNTRELMICHLCQHRHGGFNPAVRFPNKDVCCLCSNIVFSQNYSPARVCAMHAIKNKMNSNVSSCAVCARPVFLAHAGQKVGGGPIPARLCQFCGFGVQGKSCCEFKDFVV